MITDLVQAASLAPSCYNKQPWRYVFVEDDKLRELHTAQAKEILDIPQDMELISLLAISKQSDTINPNLSSDQVETEKERPERLDLEEFVYKNSYR
ncbi:hypothetical protein JCM15060_24610 [Halanaerobaculum tunisiense]